MGMIPARHQILGLQAVEHRLQALNEYLAVYRASQASSPSSANQAAVRELGRDVWRLRAWGWYLQAQRQQARWLTLLHTLVALVAWLVPMNRGGGKRRIRSRWMSHLSSHSLVERAYSALEDDLQGRLLTLRLAQHQRPNDSRAQVMASLSSTLSELEALRRSGLPEPRRLSVICTVLAVTLRLRRWAGMGVPLADMVDR